MKTIVLLSGGLDSAVVLASCVANGDEVLAVGFDYCQPHHIELKCAEILAERYKVQFEIAVLPEMPKVNDVVFAGRNLVFAATAIAIAQSKGFNRIAVGCNASDWQRFPDCRPVFWRSVSMCAGAYEIGVITPLIYLSKQDVVQEARRLNVPIDLTWSCYSPILGEPCNECLACETRNKALAA